MKTSKLNIYWFLNDQFQWNDAPVPIDHKCIVHCFPMELNDHNSRDDTGQYSPDDHGQNNEPVQLQYIVDIFKGCFHTMR